jgi:hypothetical protein
MPLPKGGGPVGGFVGAILIPIIVVLLVGSFLFLPLSPTISGSLTIETIQGYPKNHVKLAASVSYSRDTLFRSIPVGLAGTIELPIRPSVVGSYTLTIRVSYGTGPPLEQVFDQIGDGTYGFKIRYILQQETAITPYSITISISGQDIETASTAFMVYPS